MIGAHKGTAMPVSRKLVAVVAADVVGYSRLMERDEAGTHERLRALTRDLIAPKIAERGGRTVKTSGDGMLLEFPSATSALRCAVDVQREMGARNLYLAPEERIEFRIGINLGDIIVEGDDIVGEGVNVAARLETLAEPGGICVAEAVFLQARRDLGVEFVDAGEKQVKNISKHIHVYHVVLGKGPGASGAAPAPNARRFGMSRKSVAVATGVLLFAVVMAAVWRVLPHPGVAGNAAGEAPTHSVMIVPFVGAAGDAALEGTAARLTADITRALGDSMPDMRVAPVPVAANIAAKTTDARAMGREANVRYLIQGDLLPTGTQIAATLRLVDTRDGRQIQTERRVIERSGLEDREPLIRQLTYAARVMLTDAILRAMPKPGSETTAQDFVDRSRALTIDDPVARAREMRRLADQAIRLDPKLAGAWTQRVISNVDLFENDFTVDRERILAEADADSLRAVTLDPRDPSAWWARAFVLGYVGNLDAAFAANDRAHDIDPTRFSPVILRGWLYLSAGKPSEALKVVDSLQVALGTMHSELQAMACAAHLALGAYEEAIAACDRAAASDASWFIFANLTAAYAMRGNTEKAAQAKARLLKVQPAFTIGRYEAKSFSSIPAALALDKAHLIAGLRKAGVPE
jgi:class 3 adenylate cyclase/tetratricopeptide (TPR) repeat protein